MFGVGMRALRQLAVISWLPAESEYRKKLNKELRPIRWYEWYPALIFPILLVLGIVLYLR